MAYGRKPNKEPEQTQPEQSNPNKKLSKTDQSFLDRAVHDSMGMDAGIKPEEYYYFTANRHERKCRNCSEAFVTSLRGNLYCSYDCSQKAFEQPGHSV